jgi:hypothetical protein
MTNPTSNFGWQMPTSADLVTDLPADFEVFGQAVDTDFVDLLGGTTGQVLSKTSATDLDFTWVTANPGDITGVTAGTGISGGGTSGTVTVSIDTAVTADLTTSQTLTNKTLTSPALTTPTISTLTTNGDLLYGTGSGALARKAIGTTGQVLTVAAGIPSWATPAGGTAAFVGAIAYGAVNLAYSATNTAVSSLTTELADTNTFHSTSTNTSRMTIPSGYDGKYKMEMNIQFAGVTGPVTIRAYKNGSQITEGLSGGIVGQIPYTANVIVSLTVGTVVTGVATDYFEFFVQTTGASTLDAARYSFTYLGA